MSPDITDELERLHAHGATAAIYIEYKVALEKKCVELAAEVAKLAEELAVHRGDGKHDHNFTYTAERDALRKEVARLTKELAAANADRKKVFTELADAEDRLGKENERLRLVLVAANARIAELEKKITTAIDILHGEGPQLMLELTTKKIDLSEYRRRVVIAAWLVLGGSAPPAEEK
jgi:septal ring factor EnvC (AmiA/AmiB activator)